MPPQQMQNSPSQATHPSATLQTKPTKAQSFLAGGLDFKPHFFGSNHSEELQIINDTIISLDSSLRFSYE